MIHSLVTRISDIVVQIEKVFLGLLMIAITGIVFANVFCRYLFNAPLLWGDELPRFLFTWVTFLGASVGITTHAHVAIDNFAMRLSEKTRGFLEIVVSTSLVVVLCFLIVYGIRLMKLVPHVTLSATGIPLKYWYMSVPLSAVGMIIHFLAFISAGVQKARQQEEVKAC
jgi:TRAP-type C4-dicarboxylate transport system permease small subunit